MIDRETAKGSVLADDLTWREQEVLTLLCERLTNREIAQQLHLSESTVKDYVSNILSKLYVNNRREAVEKAKQLNLFESEHSIPANIKSNLPLERTPFVGRDEEIQEISRELDQTRLLSLIGPGGIGKTRLALKVAESSIEDFSDGAFFVRLAPLQASRDIVQTIAESIKIPIATQENPLDQLNRYLRDKELLLVMDNFEHLMDGVGIITDILAQAFKVKILATSRERLNLQIETIYQISGLSFPSQLETLEMQRFDAISLFIQRVGKIRPGFAPSADELKKIAKICHSVRGMPLAIELAAAWFHILNVDDILSELEKDPDILTTDTRDTPERHRSIRAVFDSSWSMLNQSEKEMFKRLSVFRGGFTREAAKQVAGASLIQLGELVNKSLINLDPTTGRLEVHELLRQYAQEKLDENSAESISTQNAHAQYYADFMQQAWQDLKSERQLRALTEIDADIENVRTAWRLNLEQKNATQLWKFVYGLWYIHWIRWWNQPGAELFAEAAHVLGGEEDQDSIVLKALIQALGAYFLVWLDSTEYGYDLAKSSVEVLEQHNQPIALTFAYYSLVVNAYFTHLYSEYTMITNIMTNLAAQTGDKWLQAFSLFAKGLMTILHEDYEEATKLAKEQLKLYEELGVVIDITTPLIVLGHAALGMGRLQEAKGFYLRCIKIAQENNFYYSIQTATKYMSKVSLEMGELADAEEYLCRSMAISLDIGFIRDIVNLVYEFSKLEVARGEIEKAVELLALVIQHPASQAYRMQEGRIRDSARVLLEKLENQMPRIQFSAAQERGQQLDLDKAARELISI